LERKNSHLISFVAFDIETTGLLDSDKIIEFGAVKVLKGEVKEEFQTLINPDKYVPIEVLTLTGIKNEELRKAPHMEEMRQRIENFISDFPLVAQNAPFDISFIERQVCPVETNVYDTLVLSRILFPFITNHKLVTLFNTFFEGTPTFHRALDDASATAKVFLKLKETAEKLPLNTLKKILSISDELKDDSLHIFSDAMNKTVKNNTRTVNSEITEENVNVPENIIDFNVTTKQKDYPTTEKEVERILSNKKILNRFVCEYEKRTEQIELAKKVMRTFAKDEILVSEAGTGTGKTFAYLIPSILWSNSRNERVIISTYTKNLQEQLFFKDIKNISNGLLIRFKAALLKGRNNYLCIKRWNNMFNEGFHFLDIEEKRSLLNLIVWQEKTKTGDITENTSFWIFNNASLWSKLSCDTRECEMNKCSFFAECYLAKIRKEAQEANIVVINHSLLFSDMNAEQKILGEYDRLIVDEAHNLEKAATSFLGTTITSWKVRNILDTLYRKDQGLLFRIQNVIGFLSKKEQTFSIDEIDKGIDMVKKNKKMLAEIVQDMIRELENSEYAGRFRLKESDKIIQEIKPVIEEMYANFRNICIILGRFSELFEGKEKSLISKEFIEQILRTKKELEQVAKDLYAILSCSDRNFCYWIESTNESPNVKFLSAPISVAPLIKERLFDNLSSAVLVSATTLIENRFTYLEEQLGLIEEERLTEFAAGSSFNFDEQVLALLPYFLTEPQKKAFFMDITDILSKIILSTRKGSLILFTSYRLLNRVYEQLVETLLKNDILLLAQGKTGSKSTITKEFNETENSVLFGTYSFWEGFDAPGKSLEILVITKLPFPSPKEPIIEARAEHLESQGVSSFDNLFVPEAIIKLRQGFGRLIRKRTDRGVVLILDSRLVKKNYGTRFLKSLPTAVNICYTENELLVSIKDFWSETH